MGVHEELEHSCSMLHTQYVQQPHVASLTLRLSILVQGSLDWEGFCSVCYVATAGIDPATLTTKWHECTLEHAAYSNRLATIYFLVVSFTKKFTDYFCNLNRSIVA